MIRTFFKMISIYLALAVALMTLPAQGWAMFIPAGVSADKDNAAHIRTMLESKIVKQRLADLGLSEEQAAARINGLSEEQIHRFAEKMDSLQAGADTVDAIVILLLIAVLVVGILELSGHTVMVR